MCALWQLLIISGCPVGHRPSEALSRELSPSTEPQRAATRKYPELSDANCHHLGDGNDIVHAVVNQHLN